MSKWAISSFLALWLWVPWLRAQTYEPIANWHYNPVDTGFWKSFLTLQDEKKIDELFLKVNRQFEKTQGLEQAEAKLAVALLLEAGGTHHLAQRIALEIIEQNPGSMPAQRSLGLLETIFQNHQFYEEDVMMVLNQAKFLKVPQDSMSMVSYYVGMDNLKKGFKVWADRAFKTVVPDSYWGMRLSFYRALKLVESDKLQEALALLTQIKEKSSSYSEFTNVVALQEARLLYELNQYEASESTYSKLKNLGRETGRAILERAWIRFHQKDYSTTLGMLESLKSPYFSNSISPEQYILSMLTYKQLCYYSSVHQVSREFNKVFGQAIDSVRKNDVLTKNATLMRMALQKANFQPFGDFVGYVRQEKANPSLNFKMMSSKLKRYFSDIYLRDEKNMMARTESKTRSDLKVEADFLLKMTEQVKLIEYLSGLDEFRQKNLFENRKYASQEVEPMAANKMYWPSLKEFWTEELPNYKVILRDRCNSGESTK